MERTFVTWYDPKLECRSVWDGTSTPYLLATREDTVSMASSLVNGVQRQPAKALGPSGGLQAARGNGLIQAAIRT